MYCEVNSIVEFSVIFFVFRCLRLWKVFFGMGMWLVSRK